MRPFLPPLLQELQDVLLLIRPRVPRYHGGPEVQVLVYDECIQVLEYLFYFSALNIISILFELQPRQSV